MQLHSYLTKTAKLKDKNVVIIGGGDTGCDCIATLLRQVKIVHRSRGV
jgi:NADPH-dependent glutamate synthase beta subunit-like oxidoreductase